MQRDNMALKCNVCGQEFGNDISLTQHLKDKHRIENSEEIQNTVASAKNPVNKMSGAVAKKRKLLLAIVGIIVGVFVVYSIASAYAKSNTLSIDGIQCNSLEGSVLHIHPHLSIIYNNQTIVVPAHIGILSSCLYWLHTHDTSGTIHVESPIFSNYTLGQFIDIWNATQPYLGNGQTLESMLQGNVTAYVGNATYSGNYRNIILKDGEQIKLVITKV